MELTSSIPDILARFFQAISWVPYALAFGVSFHFAKSSWGFWREEVYKNSIDWILIEVRIPRETTRGPKAMEQILAAISNLANSPVGLKETYWDGEITRWYSFEIVGSRGETHLYIRLPRMLLHPFVSTFYSQYPDVEIVEAERDYIHDLPATYQELKKNRYELYGMEVKQRQNPAYSFNTYIDFETKVGDEKGRIIDPMAALIEIIGRLKPDETVWVQFLVIPDTKEHWLHDADHIISKMKSMVQGGESMGGASGPSIRLRFRTQGEDKTLKQIEEKKGKAIYETLFRAIYVAPDAMFNRDLMNRGVFGYLAQFNNDHQSMKKIDKIRSKVEWDSFPFFFPKRRLFWKRVAILDEYRRRFIPEESFMGKIHNSYLLRWCFFHKPMILSCEELATFYHIPTSVILTSVTFDRIESKRLSPPSNLPG